MTAPAAFDRACRELFSGWERVETLVAALDDGYWVRLYVGSKALAYARMDRSALTARLFRRTKLVDLAERIERNQARLGLRRYGRKRR